MPYAAGKLSAAVEGATLACASRQAAKQASAFQKGGACFFCNTETSHPAPFFRTGDFSECCDVPVREERGSGNIVS